MRKHAFLVIAHKSGLAFETLIKMLDDDRSDIFIHFDAKSKSYDPKRTETLVHKSRLFHTKRTKVAWGGTAKSMLSCYC